MISWPKLFACCFVVGIAVIEPTLGCECIHVRPQYAFFGPNSVFRATVISRTQDRVVLQPTEWFKGRPSERIELIPKICSFYAPGLEFVVYADQREDGLAQERVCQAGGDEYLAEATKEYRSRAWWWRLRERLHWPIRLPVPPN